MCVCKTETERDREREIGAEIIESEFCLFYFSIKKNVNKDIGIAD